MSPEQFAMLFDADLRAKREDLRAVCAGITIAEVIAIWQDLETNAQTS